VQLHERTRVRRDLPVVPPGRAPAPRPFCPEAALERAFQLAHRIHPDRGRALQVAAQALAKLELAMLVQDKRRYYHPRGQGGEPPAFRTRVSFGEWALLQRLVYIESEPFEREAEAAGTASLTQDDLLVRFVKHLVRITTRRNSFYVTLGVSRLLHDYSTGEAMHLYQVVLQDADRTKDDYYFRSRKAVLVRELQERFGGLLETRRRARGEVRFHGQPATPRQAELVAECLRLFTPWETTCALPDGFDPMGHPLPALASGGPEHEDVVEVARMHALIHPDCFARMAAGLGLPLPAARLEVPRFDAPSPGRGGGGGGESPPLSAEERGWLKHVLAGEAQRRRAARPQVLRAAVAGPLRRLARALGAGVGRWHALAGAGAAVLAVGLAASWLRRTPPAAAPGASPAPPTATAPAGAPRASTPRPPAVHEPAVPEIAGATRSGSHLDAPGGLRQVRRLWIDAPSKEWREGLRRHLAGLEVVDEPEMADAALKVTTRGDGSHRARVVGSAGEVLWPEGGGAAVYRGSAAEVAARLGGDLARARGASR
jgi:hypothetical protein